MSVEAPAATHIAARIRAVLDEYRLFDPREIAAAVLADLPDDELREALAITLPFYAARTIRRAQRNPRVAPQPGTSRWDRVAKDLEVYRRLECVNGRWRPLGELTSSEVRTLGANRLHEAMKCKHQAARFASLANEMDRKIAETVSDVPAARVMEILYA